MTNDPRIRERSVVRLSVTPSTKCSCSASPPILANGRTTIERRGGPCRFGSEGGVGAALVEPVFSAIGPHRPRDVLERLLAEIDEVRVDLAAHMLVGRARNQHAARLANPFQPRRDIDAIAQNVVALDQHVAEIDADAVDDALRLGRRRRCAPTISFWIAIAHSTAATTRGKLQQQPVAHRLDDAAAALRHQRPRRLAMLAHRPRRPRLVLAHQAGVADDVDGHDRGEFTNIRHSVPRSEAEINIRVRETKDGICSEKRLEDANGVWPLAAPVGYWRHPIGSGASAAVFAAAPIGCDQLRSRTPALLNFQS